VSDPIVSVVIPALNAEATLAECLRAIQAQSLPASQRELIVIADTRSTDRTTEIARGFAAKVISTAGPNAGAARNRGVAAARGSWVAFIDADCIPTRTYLQTLIDRVEAAGTIEMPALGAAGQVVGYQSDTPAARFVDLTGGLRADKHLAHQRYPWAPTASALYRRRALLAVAGFDERFDSYEGCDLHTRLRRSVGGAFIYVPNAVTLHRHRAGWRAYWRQQRSYGRGFAQFFLGYSDEIDWTARDEARAWLRLAGAGLNAARPGAASDTSLLKRGAFIKAAAQRVGFAATYWRPGANRRWRRTGPVGIEAAS
jgi:glycosyltransferase involved in cell wall biosynthesis